MKTIFPPQQENPEADTGRAMGNIEEAPGNINHCLMEKCQAHFSLSH